MSMDVKVEILEKNLVKTQMHENETTSSLFMSTHCDWMDNSDQ